MDDIDRYTPYKKALKEAGFVVAGIKRQGKRTVVSVFRPGQGSEKPALPAAPRPSGRNLGH